jgi:acyl-CoA synthetase (AMP-forming)/AMP-acid ligase II
MTAPQTVEEILARGSDAGQAIAAPQRQPMSYAALRRQVRSTAEELRRLGLRQHDAVGIVLPNGPQMATAFLAVASAAAAAPLNPAYRQAELEFYLADLGARALLLAAGDESAAADAARRLNLPVIDLIDSPDERAGSFRLSPRAPTRGEAGPPARSAAAGDTALLLHTSGTTSRPKLVRLTHANLAASAANVAQTLALTPADLCLNVMPLFHIHGLVAAVLASLHAGAAVACTPGFSAFKFFAWMDELKPTWYTAVPTMHQVIVQRGRRHGDVSGAGALRLIRSSSAPLAPRLMAQLEELFAVPVIESYGMTEAAHQICSNPLPPRRRKPGSVGIAAGPRVAVMAADGRLLAPGEVGEVAIRGANVTPGYVNNPEANAATFAGGWLRTGDQGVLDADGYLTLNGRLKEIINRGGEKISPREVDEVLLEHPQVAQAVTFAMPHESLGEDVAAAVVLHPDADVDVRRLREFAAERLAEFKVPRKVLIVDAIPTGSTGKPQRIGLAQRLGLAK